MLNAGSAMNRCARYTALSGFRLRDLASTLLIPSNSPRRLSRTYSEMHSAFGTLSARSHQGFNSRLKGVARVLAVVIGLSLSIASIDRSEASIVPLKVLANKQLTDKQYNCHNEIVYRESRWNIDAVNGSHHGYYQMRTESMKNKPYDYQFYIYWYYVSKRYGLDYEIPDYCKALHHLKTKGWQ
jgi:hypothetical protein